MGLADPASLAPLTRRRPPAGVIALAMAGLLAGCAHLPPLVESQDPLSAEEHSRLGASYEAQGLRGDAVGQYQAAVRRDPADAQAWVALGNLSFEDGDFAGAERFYRRALKAAPRNAGAGNNLAMVYLAQNDKLPEAERLAQEALEQGGPLKPYVLDTLANVYLRQKRWAEARAALEQAEAAAPADDASFRGRLSQTRGKVAAALAEEEPAR